jgi:hypothetical protein
MTLDGKSVEQLVRIFGTDRQLIARASSVSGLTLGAVLELSAQFHQGLLGSTERCPEVERIANQPILQRCLGLWNNPGRPNPFEDTHGTRELDFCSINRPQDILDETWHVFESRFARTMKQRGFDSSFCDAYMGVLGEMADNIVQHSGPDESHPAAGLVGFVVDENSSTFVLIDLGAGALQSLTRNPAWTTLASERDALSAMVEKSASRRTAMGPGSGYRDLFRALADRNCVIRLKSGDGVYELRGAGAGRQSESYLRPRRGGFSIEVTCFLARTQKEKIFSVDTFT